MSYLIRPIEPAEFDDYRRVMARGFGNHPRPEDSEFMRSSLEFDRTLAAYDDGQIVGTTAIFSFDLAVPGGALLAAAGVTMVAVLTTHRRRGILTQIMRRQLSDVRARGESLAVLWASESSIYRRFGYGIASHSERWSIDRSRARFDPPVIDKGRVRAIDSAGARKLAPSIYEQAARARPGMLLRNDKWWDARLRDPEHWRWGGASANFFAVHETDNAVDGYVIYRYRRDWRDGVPASSVTDIELLGTDANTEAALWQFCLSVDLTETVECWNRPVDDPLWWRLADPRRLRRTPRDGLWARIVDVPAALSSRRYPVADRLVLEVNDDFAGLAAGRFEVEGGPDGAKCATTTRPADLKLGASELASLYLGGGNPLTMAAAGRLTEITPGALRRANLMFGWHVAPWCILDF
ncbi:MAG: GNAT family N-acetyltransferase [Chloroflexi bacterium]|nr:GNAT family N-acetyltransferase [Chloroflexota bacterium]